MAETNETDDGFSAKGLSGMARIEAMIAPALESMGYGIVRVAFVKGGRATLQIMTERLDGQGMSVDDCADISRAVSAILDVEDPISSAYMLEVSSPGIDRPLVKRADFTRFAGFVAKIETERLIDGRKRFSGRLLGIGDDDQVRVKDEAVEYAVPFDAITKAKLVLTDDLLANSPDRPRT